VYSSYNRDFNVLRRIVTAESVSKRGASSSSQKSFRVLTYHTNGLRTPNALVDMQGAAARCASMVYVANPDLVTLQAVPEEAVEMLRGLLAKEFGLEAVVACGIDRRLCVFVRRRMAATATIVGCRSAIMAFAGGPRVACIDASKLVDYYDQSLFQNGNVFGGVLMEGAFDKAYRRGVADRSRLLEDVLRSGPVDVIAGSLGFFTPPNTDIHPPERSATLADFAFPVARNDATTLNGWVEDYILVRGKKAATVRGLPFTDSSHPALVATLPHRASTLSRRQQPAADPRRPELQPSKSKSKSKSKSTGST
jgi:hypothetical protein